MMSDTGENFSAFNSRALVEMVGGVTDEALKVTRIKQFLSVLAGRFFNWAGRKSLFKNEYVVPTKMLCYRNGRRCNTKI